MKEATGELNMTVITLIAIAAIMAVFAFIVWPLVQRTLVTQTCRTTYGPDYSAVKTGESAGGTGNSQVTVNEYQCCLNGEAGTCFPAN